MPADGRVRLDPDEDGASVGFSEPAYVFLEPLADAGDLIEPPRGPNPAVAVQTVHGFHYELNILGGKLLYYPASLETMQFARRTTVEAATRAQLNYVQVRFAFCQQHWCRTRTPWTLIGWSLFPASRRARPLE